MFFTQIKWKNTSLSTAILDRGRKPRAERACLAAIFLVVLMAGVQAASAQAVSLTTTGVAYTQDFDTLSNVAASTTNNLTITGWFMTETGGGARDNEQYAVDTGASTVGDTYSFGAAAGTNRALGGLRSGTLIPNFGAAFTNNTGATITALDIAYFGEEWRLGTVGRADQLNFEYSLNATDLTTGTWTNVAALNFLSPDTATVGAKNGDAAAERTSLTSSITGLSIPNGATFWIRWTDIDVTGADDGLAVDDFSLTPQSTTAAPASLAGRVLTMGGRGLGNVRVTLTDQAGQPRTAVTSPFGYYQFDNLPTGETYTVSVSAKGRTFAEPTRVVTLNDAVDDLNFTSDN